MCYSAMVLQDLGRLSREFGASIDLESFVRLFAMRAKDPALKIPMGLESYFLKTGGAAERSIKHNIESFKTLEKAKHRQELQNLEAELNELKNRLKIKITKTHQKSFETKTRKYQKLLEKAEAAAKEQPEQEFYRIYPYYFAPTIVMANNKRLLTPMRYRILPRTGVEIPNKYNVFNARRDSLQEARTWKASFGQQHALFPFIKFYEWVEDEQNKKVELSFSPDGFDSMWAASLYEGYNDNALGIIRSFAMVTDEPPPEVAAAGHDRCPVFLEHSKIDQWLSPKDKNLSELDLLLDHKEPAYYSHIIAA